MIVVTKIMLIVTESTMNVTNNIIRPKVEINSKVFVVNILKNLCTKIANLILETEEFL